LAHEIRLADFAGYAEFLTPSVTNYVNRFPFINNGGGTRLQNNNARWYDPRIGRFLSADPSGFDGGDPNLYRYVGNSPLNGADPTGLRTLKPTNYLTALNQPSFMPATGLSATDFSIFSSAPRRKLPTLDQSIQQSLSTPSFVFSNFAVLNQPTWSEIQRAGSERVLGEARRIYAGADLSGHINDPVIAALGRPRVHAGLTVAQGVAEATVATGLAVVPELATKVGAGALYVKSVDSLQAGLRGIVLRASNSHRHSFDSTIDGAICGPAEGRVRLRCQRCRCRSTCHRRLRRGQSASFLQIGCGS
jgi:RHS repeat-associated protein